MNIEVIRRAVLSSALVLLALTSSAQTDTTRKDAQSAAAAAASLGSLFDNIAGVQNLACNILGSDRGDKGHPS